jgi:hypothetical protein
MKHRVKIQLTTATCRHLERAPDAGGVFVAGAALSSDGGVKAIVTPPIFSGGGHAQTFKSPESLLFDGVLDDDGSVAVVLVARYDAVEKDWRKRGEWAEAIEDSILNADARGAAAIAAWITDGNHVGWVVLVGAIGVGLSLGIYFPVPAIDADPLLGHLAIVVKAAGAVSEMCEWSCEQDGAAYKLCYEVTRTRVEPAAPPLAINAKRRGMLVDIIPAAIVRGHPARFTVSAVDAETRSSVAGTVRLLDLHGIFPTNVPFDATLRAGPLTGIRGAIARGFGRMPLNDLLDDGFDWAALEHRMPKGLVTAADYEARAVMFDVS